MKLDSLVFISLPSISKIPGEPPKNLPLVAQAARTDYVTSERLISIVRYLGIRLQNINY